MARILFSHSYFLRLDPKQWEAGNAYPPLATLYAAAYLRELGHEVELFDPQLLTGPETLKPMLETSQPDYLVLYEDGFNYLTKMCLTNMREAAFEMMGFARAQEIPVLVSGSDSTDHYDKYLDAGADFVMLGEGEATLAELIGALESKTEIKDIPGLAYRSGNETVLSGRRPVLRDLDALPLPAWDLVDFASYQKIWMEKAGYFSLNLVSSRGCTYKCNWCAKPLFGNRYHARTPEQVLEEIKLLQQKTGVQHFWFSDDIFGLKPGWLPAFADLVERSGLKFRFKIQCRADLMVKEESVKALARAGCDTVWLGAESGSQEILDAMEKGITLEQIYQSRALLKQYGVRTAFFLQFGYPGETMKEIRQTIRMVLDTMPDEIGISVTYPLPGTKLYERVKDELKEKANWTDSDELAMLFKNTYPPGFYKELQRYMHTVYRRKKSLLAAKHILRQPWNLKPGLLRSAVMSLYHGPMSLIRFQRIQQWQSKSG